MLILLLSLSALPTLFSPAADILISGFDFLSAFRQMLSLRARCHATMRLPSCFLDMMAAPADDIFFAATLFLPRVLRYATP